MGKWSLMRVKDVSPVSASRRVAEEGRIELPPVSRHVIACNTHIKFHTGSRPDQPDRSSDRQLFLSAIRFYLP